MIHRMTSLKQKYLADCVTGSCKANIFTLVGMVEQKAAEFGQDVFFAMIIDG